MPLRAADLGPDPFAAFERWYAEAGVDHPEAVALATATPDGRPSARMVLCRSFDRDGFVFFTDRGSRKGRELTDNPRAALLFHWPGRQVRIEGPVDQVTDDVSDAYWSERSLESRYSALASLQSERVDSREVLEERVAELRGRHGDEPPRPDRWGGYRLSPAAFEFWQHGPDRLHDRFRFTPEGGGWRRVRLMP